ncbi:Rv2629 family ribosome hibernation factor [Mycolicibacterium psychrotolerans]|uniref:Uncharacterized protein n=1 Tax=Mycolicibacterium psychrotolerans TaxID=216929 RepID=A0A7I7MK13_9MYCO|nr:hypothetical protein [Mycolicibacterium psychrotolerans]BBX71853.1 hypothetical protein MPSYJ_53140 [Mycolicibacterium psychrotolerans]
MSTEHLRVLADAPGPFVSLYIDGTGDTQNDAARWSAIREHLEDCGVTGRTIEAVERAVLTYQPAPHRRGHAVIAGGEGVLVDEPLIRPPAVTVLRVSVYPYVVPLLSSETARPPYIFAAVDHLGADLTVHRDRAVEHETVQCGGFPVHKPASAGWNGYGDMQHSAEEAVRMNVRAIVDRITKLADQSHAELVFVCGEVRSRSDVLSELPHRIAARVVSLPAHAEGGRADERKFAVLVDSEFAQRGRDRVAMVVARYQSETGRRSDLAVQGLPAVCTALRDGAVDTLIISDLGSATVVSGDDRTMVAADADALSMFGEAPRRVALADEVLPFVAIATDASVVIAEHEIAVADGVAAVLRYPQTNVTGAAGSSQRSVPS